MTAVLGGGISGLSAAYYCLENPKIKSIVLYETSTRLGGWIKSDLSPNGVIFEKGPHTIRFGNYAAENTLKLIDKLNLSHKIIPIQTTHPAYSNKLIYVNKQLYTLPNKISSIFKTQKPFNRPLISVIWNELKSKKIIKEDESIYTFVERRMGKDIADYLISPLICGICAGNAKEISVKFLLKRGFEFEQKYGSMTKGIFLYLIQSVISSFKIDNLKKQPKRQLAKNVLVERAKIEKWSAWSLIGGLEEFPKALKNNLKSNSNIEIYTNTKCEHIIFKPGVAELIVNGKIKKYCRIISSLSAKNLAPLLQRQHPYLSKEIEAIPFVSIVVVNLHYSGNLLPVESFGLLVPPNQNLPILGIIFDSCIFKNKSNTVLTVMMGGKWFDKYFSSNTTNEYFLTTAVNQTKYILNIEQNPIEYNVTVLKDCIPQYIIGHSQRIQRIHNYITSNKIPLALCGSSFHGIGLNEVILSAKQAVSQIA